MINYLIVKNRYGNSKSFRIVIKSIYIFHIKIYRFTLELGFSHNPL
jgi:hypothetical protein